MKSDVQKLQGLTRKLSVEVPQEIVNAALEKGYAAAQKAAKFKGFRPGKAPMQMVRTEYRSKVESDVATQIIQDHYGKALDEHDLNPVNYPEIEFDGLTEGQPLKFSATFEVRPDVTLKQYTDLSVEKEKLVVDEKSVDQILEDIRKNRAQEVPVIELRAAKMGDVAVVDFVGRKDGTEFPGGKGEEYHLELGAKQFIPGFEEGIVGMNNGETKVLPLRFPDEYHEKSLAGKDIEFTVTLKELKTKRLPELNDEFAKEMGTHETLTALRAEITKDVTAREEKRVRDDLKNRMLRTLVEKNPFEVPRAMIAEQKKVIIDDVHHRMESQGMPHDQFDEYKTKWDADFEKSADFVIRSSMLVNTIAKKENLFSTDAEFAAKLESYAKDSGIEIEKIRAFYSKDENRSRLRFQLTEEKVMDFLISKSKIKEVPREKLTPEEE